MDLDRRAGPFTLRAWGLGLNLVANVVMLHGAVRYFTAGASPLEMLAGLIVTALCVATLSIPSK